MLFSAQVHCPLPLTQTIVCQELLYQAEKFHVDYARYHFIIEFFLPVDKYGCEYEVREREVRFSLRKKEADWWPRLLYENIKVRNRIK